jgi:hypothetical protein
MTQREPTAAEALYGHLPHDAQRTVPRREHGSLARAMYPGHRSSDA